LKRERFSLKEQYKKSWNYIKESKNFIYAAIIIFVVFALIGFFVPVPADIKAQIMDYIQKIIQKTEGLGGFGLITYIFANNIQSSFTGMVFGIVLGIFPVIGSIANGYMVGFVSAMSANAAGIGSLWRLFPHGIFELPAIFISFGLGIKFGTFFYDKNAKETFLSYLRNSLRVFIFVVIPLLIIAAIIEGSLIFILG